MGIDVAGEEWKKLFLFGINMNKKDSKVNLWNMLLSNARYAIWVRRNMAYYDRKKVDVMAMFKMIFRKNVYLMWKYLPNEEFERAFVEGSELIIIEGKKGLCLKF